MFHVMSIVTQQLFCEVRQYMPEISLMYGRDAHGYIRHCEAYESNTFYYLEVVNPADYEYVLTCATMFGYNFIVVEEWKAIEETLLDKYDFYPVANVAGYIVYYNEEITYVQEDDVRLD